jgi:small basic protein
MDAWNRLRDPIASLMFGILTVLVATGHIPEAIDEHTLLELVSAAMAVAAGVATMINRRQAEPGAPDGADES